MQGGCGQLGVTVDHDEDEHLERRPHAPHRSGEGG